MVKPQTSETISFPDDDAIHVKALRTEIQQDTIANFQGKVEIISNSAQIRAEQALIDKNAQQLKATGNIRYQDRQIQVESDNIKVDIQSGQLALDETRYQMLNFTGRGQAGKIALNQQQGILLEDLSFTTCPMGAEDWKIQASSLELKPGEIWGSAKHARFYIMDVPVLYLPYFSFPVTNLRQSGWLFPELSSSDRYGVSYEQPYYWNIAPNMDATISPRYLTDRGLQLKTEFRYLTQRHSGQLNLEYLPSDKRSNEEQNRYFYRMTHLGNLNANWQVSADINGLSDDNYIIELGSDFYNRADTHLYQTVGVNYYSDQLNFSAHFRDFEVIGNHPDSYRALPEMRLQYFQPAPWGMELKLHSEMAYFDNGNAEDPTALRVHLAPTLSLPYNTSWGEFLAESTLMHTYYKQDNIDNTQLDSTVNRTLSRSRLYGAITLERSTQWFGQSVTQTLEPKAQYLYTSYEAQGNIGLYDTTYLQNDFFGLFRGQEFTGLDRISDTNQFTVGLTTRIIDENDQEQFRLSLGQIFYLQRNQVLEASKNNDKSALAAELDWRVNSKWYTHTEIQMSAESGKVEKSNLSLEYRMAENKLLQFSHRYVRDISDNKIDQLGITASWPIAKNWHWVGRWYKDINQHRTIESYTGIQYESCCWAMQLVAQRHLSNRFDTMGGQSTDEYDSGISLKFVFKGMSSSSSARKMLNNGLFGYRQPYFLNN